jgi:hypothetical protein
VIATASFNRTAHPRLTIVCQVKSKFLHHSHCPLLTGAVHLADISFACVVPKYLSRSWSLLNIASFSAPVPCISRKSVSAILFFAFGSFRFRNIVVLPQLLTRERHIYFIPRTSLLSSHGFSAGVKDA